MIKRLTIAFIWLACIQISCAQQNTLPSISPTELKSEIGGDNVVLFDVRKPEEIDAGVIDPGVLNYNFFDADFKDNVAELDKDKTYYVYCHAGGRSAKTVKMMQELGFKSVYNVDGGITQWRSDGNQTVPIKE